MIYALVLPVIEIFVAAYVMRNSQEVSRVVTYQLAIYAATPLAFFINGKLLRVMSVRTLYGLGMLLSGVAMVVMMYSSILTPSGIAVSGLLMGMATGLFWANRGFLALATTNDENRNYYYGLELFVATTASVVVPAVIGWFISGTMQYGWLGGSANRAYKTVAIAVLVLTVWSSLILRKGHFRNPEHTRFVYFRFHPMWRQMLVMAMLKGLAQGYIVTAPAMLILLLVGQEGTLGATQAIGGLFSACVMYTVGRAAKPKHRLIVFSIGLSLFLLGSVLNTVLFDALGVLLFLACLILSKPLLDLAYFPIQLRVMDVVSQIERRNEYAYIFNHEFGLFLGRSIGCGLFLCIAHWWSGIAALKYALPMVALFQALSIGVASLIQRNLDNIKGDATEAVVCAEVNVSAGEL